MNIREMIETDYDQVYQLWLSCVGMGLNDLDDSKEGIARFLQRNPQTDYVHRLYAKSLSSSYQPPVYG